MKLAASVVALMVAAVALIGVAYAAYTATLSDTENVTVNNYYVELELGEHSFSSPAKMYYKYEVVYTGGASPVKTYTPYMDKALTTGEQVQKIGSFQITKDDTNKGDISTTTYTLDVSSVTITDGTPSSLTGLTVGVYTNEACTSAATLSSLSYGTTYYMGLVYNQNGTTDQSATAPSATITVAIAYNASANVA